MCGITGIYNVNQKPVDKDLVLAMTRKISHRGPDDEGIFVEGSIGLGNRRLSIIDVSVLGHQPMTNEEKTLWMTYNGEVYNFQELRQELEVLGHTFSSKTDTEVVLKSYQQWGAKCLEKFNGMFALAIFDIAKQELFLARDRMGKKPLYYYFDSQKIVFGSEIKSILEDRSIVRRVDQQGMVNYFTFGHSIAPDTIYEGIKKLPAGHYLTIKSGALEIKEYWDLPIIEPKKDLGQAYYQEKILDILSDSVKRRLISDVPVGLFLSGGLDSSSILAMMVRHGAKNINTFSVGFGDGGKEFNELSDAKLVAEFFKTRHHEVILNEKDLVENLENIVHYFDEPFGDAANFPMYCISQFAKNHVKVVLSGEGGDEIFGGYRRYMVEQNLRIFSLFNVIAKNRFVQKIVGSQSQFKKIRQLIQSLPIKNDLARQTNWLVCFSKEMRDQLFNGNFLQKDIDPLKTYKQLDARHHGKNLVENMMYLDQKVLLTDGYLEKVDKATMSAGIEARAPFLDYRLVEFANEIPAHYKINGMTAKYILKKVMKVFLPSEIIKKGKHGFAVPINLWFKGALKEYMHGIIFDPRTKARPYFNFDYIEKMYTEYQQEGKPFHYQLWLLVNFELWHRHFIDNN